MKEKLLRARSLALSCVRNIFVNKTQFRQLDEFVSVVTNAGYQSECHNVKTDDGYKLKVHRVLPKAESTYKGSTFLMHGLFRNSCDFLASGPQTALTYYLADNGFDVWLGNARGTKFCQQHEKFTSDSKEFWDFSFHEIGLHDVSTMLNFMLGHTKEAKTFYIGHSQGTSALIALLASLPDYTKKIAQAHLMTPALFMKHSTSPMLTSSLFKSKRVMNLVRKVSKVDIALILKLSHTLCNFNGYSRDRALKIYTNFTCNMVGRNPGEVEISDEGLRTFQSFMSRAVSVRQLIHFHQLHVSGKFQQFDHEDQNLTFYGTCHPPEYNLKNVTCPVFLYSGSEDLLIPPQDVEDLKHLLRHTVKHETFQGWNHMDVMLGRNSRKILYKNILDSITFCC